MSALLIFLGACWIFYATINPEAMKTRAMSDAMQLETDLKGWAARKINEGKLQQGDVAEIFPEGYSLRFGGESRKGNFREMVSGISQSSAPPAWLGWLAMLIGGAGVISCLGPLRKRNAGQTAAGNQRRASG